MCLKSRAKLLFPLAMVIVGMIFLALDIFLTPILSVSIDGRVVLIRPQIYEGYPISIRFIHSVQKTPVEEFLSVKDNAFFLEKTHYQSHGVGLPFLDSEGSFRREGDLFILEGMNRTYPSLSLRVGAGTELTLRLDEDTLYLYKDYPAGTRVDLELTRIFQLK